jgi:DNA-binding transcriptional ArsR family regulator
MQNGRKQSPEETALKRAVHHPKRLEILGVLAGSKTGIDEAELVETLGESPSKVRYHLSVLQSADLVEDPARETPGRYVVVYP